MSVIISTVSPALKRIAPSIFLFLCIFSNAQNPLFIPDTITGASINLTIADSVHQFYTGYNTNTISFNGSYLGPTIILNNGQTVTMNVSNQLADTTTVHWHGLHIAPENDGGPHTTIPPSAIWNPSFPVMDVAGTYWYHPHLHMKTVEHVTKGAAGFIIIRDTIEAKLNLPRKYKTDDFPIVIQSRCFDTNKQFVVDTAGDKTILVNGTLNPVLQAPAQVIRLRLLNGSTNRIYNLGIQNNQTFHQIGSDGGLLSQPVALTRLRVAPGERAEILINLTGMQGQQVYLVNYGSELPNGIYGAGNPSAMGPGTIPGYSSNPLNGANFNILLLDVVAQTTNSVTSIPTSLVSVTPYNPSSSNLTFPITISPQSMGPNSMVNGPFELNNQLFNMNVINHTTFLGYTEIWNISNNTAIAHPFHIHGLQFYVVDRNGSLPPDNEAGRKDVILVYAQETVKLIMKFEDFTSDSVPYMYHCHMLTHEEEGMMGQYLVVDPTSVSENSNNTRLNIYPNPSAGIFTVSFDKKISSIEISDVLGNIIYRTSVNGSEKKIDLSKNPKEVYLLKILSDNEIILRKIIIH